jgi:site-specific DNA recombinase
METTERYATSIEGDKQAAIARIAIYARLSRDPDGLSANTSIQVAECLEDARRYVQDRVLRARVVVIFEENDVSASAYSNKKRPDFQRLIELIEQNEIDVIFATEVERLVRQPAEAEQLIDLAGATDLREIHLTSEAGYNLSMPSGMCQLRQAVNLAERESRKTSERLRRKLAHRARSGQPHGSRRCFGYKAGNMEIDEAEASILREMGSKLLVGCSFKEIAYWANEQGYKTAEGKMWYPVTIRNSLRRVRYAGIREHRGKQYPAAWPAIFGPATWEQMQLKIMLSAERFAGRRKARKYLLTGRVYCGKCGFSLNGETKRDQPGRPLRPVYQCRVQGDTQRIRGCGGVTINASALDWFIRESVFSRLVPGQFADLLRDAAPNDDKLKRLFDRRAAQQLRIGGLVDDYARGFLDRAELVRAKSSATAELSRIDGEIELLETCSRRTEDLTAEESFRCAWKANESMEWRDALIGRLIERIEVFPGIGKPIVNVDGIAMRFDKDRVKIVWRQSDSVAVSAA